MKIIFKSRDAITIARCCRVGDFSFSGLVMSFGIKAVHSGGITEVSVFCFAFKGFVRYIACVQILFVFFKYHRG